MFSLYIQVNCVLHLRYSFRSKCLRLVCFYFWNDTKVIYLKLIYSLFSGKLCLQNEDLAKQCIAALARELETSDDPAIRNNVTVVMCDLCVRSVPKCNVWKKNMVKVHSLWFLYYILIARITVGFVLYFSSTNMMIVSRLRGHHYS